MNFVSDYAHFPIFPFFFYYSNLNSNWSRNFKSSENEQQVQKMYFNFYTKNFAWFQVIGWKQLCLVELAQIKSNFEGGIMKGKKEEKRAQKSSTRIAFSVGVS